ncbi:hypothetical protein FS749_011189 [Ceratobasidium sp. UAMH 11750]|nr:hypothetical protein FS749_011189 [Ceratobasidium sp. UAMH 11750]
MQSMMEVAREEARKELAGRKETLDKIEDALDEREVKVCETENKAEEEREEVATSRFELEGDKKKLLEDALKVDSLISRLGEVVERSERERNEWEEMRKEAKIGAQTVPMVPATDGRLYGGPWGGPGVGIDERLGWGYEDDGFQPVKKGAVGSYAAAAARGGIAGTDPHALSEQDLTRGKERIQRGEEKCVRQLLLDANVVAGEKGLKGLTERELLN